MPGSERERIVDNAARTSSARRRASTRSGCGTRTRRSHRAWEEFAKQLFWDYQLGEAFILATSRYSTGWPARFHVVPPWTVNVEMRNGRRVYSIGEMDVTGDMLHIRYQSNVGDAHGHGPLEAGCSRTVAADVLTRYATSLVANGGIPTCDPPAPRRADSRPVGAATGPVGDGPHVRDR